MKTEPSGLKSISNDLTIDTLRKYKGFENLPDNEAEEVVKSIKKISEIFIIFLNENSTCNIPNLQNLAA